MSRKKRNQHYLPQYYFRFFSEGGKHINLLQVRNGRIVCGARIRNQCAGSYFYGTEEAEDRITEIENHGRSALSLVNCTERLPEDKTALLGAILFMRARTKLERDKPMNAMAAMTRRILRIQAHQIGDLEKRRLVMDSIDGVTPVPQSFHPMILSLALQSVELIEDLRLVLIKNRHENPFIFSDAPVVFFNEASRDITYRGTYGLQCSGLQILFPLNPRVLLMLYDPSHYRLMVPTREGVIELTAQSDLDSLNALQLHNCGECAYFHRDMDSQYIQDLLRLSGAPIKQPEASVKIAPLVHGDDGRRSEVMHMFERRLDTTLTLSVLQCTPVVDEGRVNVRNVRLVHEHASRQADLLRDLE
jgi:hypothetical protein